MASFRQGVLGSLSNIYQVIGGRQAPDKLDIEGPVTVVHDVAADAARTSIRQVNGELVASFVVDCTTAGAGTGYGTYPLSDTNLRVNEGFDLTKYWLELLGVSAIELATTPQASSGFAYISFGQQALQPNESIMCVFQHGGSRRRYTATSAMLYVPVAPQNGLFNPPLKIGLTSTLYAASTHVAAGTVRYVFNFLIVPR